MIFDIAILALGLLPFTATFRAIDGTGTLGASQSRDPDRADARSRGPLAEA